MFFTYNFSYIHIFTYICKFFCLFVCFLVCCRLLRGHLPKTIHHSIIMYYSDWLGNLRRIHYCPFLIHFSRTQIPVQNPTIFSQLKTNGTPIPTMFCCCSFSFTYLMLNTFHFLSEQVSFFQYSFW